MNNIRPYQRSVYYYETDKMSIMHHSNYIRIFEETRVDFLNQAGMPFERIEEQGLMMPVLSVSCRYKRPLRFGDTFAVYPLVTKFNGTTLELSYIVRERSSGEICAEGTSSHCFTDGALKPVRTKLKYPEIYKIFADYVGYEITD